MSHEQHMPFSDWQEMEEEKFEALVDLHSFDAMISDRTVQNKQQVTFDSLWMESDILPREFEESHYFPAQFVLSNFSTEFTRLKTAEGPDIWTLSMQYEMQGQRYSIFTSPNEMTLHTSSHDGADLEYKFSPETAARLLTSIAAVQLDMPKERVAGYLEGSQNTKISTADRIAALLKFVGTNYGGAKFTGERLAWLPLLDEERALVIKHSEIESLDHSARKLEYTMAWNIAECFGIELSSLQLDFSPTPGQEPYYSQRSGLDYQPEDLLLMKQLGSDPHVGALFDSYSSRNAHAHVATSILSVISRYLEPYKALDVEIVDPGEEFDIVDSRSEELDE